MSLRGTFTAIITPFKKSGEIDWSGLEKFVKTQVEDGVDGLVPCGTTGESPTLTHDEHRQVIARVTSWAKEVNSDIIIIAGTGSNSTAEAIELTKEAAIEGADYSLQVNPYYNKPTQKGLYQHFTMIADESSIPLILYHIPSRASVKIEMETMTRLSQHNKIVGVKEATGDLNFITELMCSVDKDFTLLSGDDNLLLPILSIGGKGIISVCSNIFPKKICQITNDYLLGDHEAAKETFHNIFLFCQSMFYETNPIPVKYALSEMGFCENVLRLPLTPLSEKYRQAIKKQL